MGTSGRILTVAAVALAPLAIGCSGGPSEPLALTQPLMPLATGTRWTYEIVDSVEVGADRRAGLPPWTFTVQVTGDTSIAGERWAVLDSAQQLLHDSYAGRYYLANRPDGTYETVPPDPNLPLPRGIVERGVLLFRYPAKRGDAGPFWSPWVVAATDTAVTVPAGVFRCLRYDMNPYVTYFVAPGVGVVKKVTGLTEARDAQGQLIGRWRLVYRLTSVSTPGG